MKAPAFRAHRLELPSFLPVDLPEPFVAGYSTRRGGVSPPPYDTLNLSFRVGDEACNVLENRRRLATRIGFDLDAFVFSQVVHGDGVALVSVVDRGRGVYDYEDAVPGADALITSAPGVVLAMNVADCVPIILVDNRTPAVAIVHAGWRGTVARIAERTVRIMVDDFGSRSDCLSAFIGPSIGPTSYVVSREVARQAVAAAGASDVITESSDGSLRLDLWSSNALTLQRGGVLAGNIRSSDIDTMRSNAFFSARRENMTGRFAALVAIQGD